MGKAAEFAISRRGGGLRAEYMTRIARAASERDPFASYMQLCTYSTVADRARVLGCSEAEVSNDAVWQQHRVTFDALPAGASFLRKAMALDLAVYLPALASHTTIGHPWNTVWRFGCPGWTSSWCAGH